MSTKDKLAYFKDNKLGTEDSDFDPNQYYYNRGNDQNLHSQQEQQQGGQGISGPNLYGNYVNPNDVRFSNGIGGLGSGGGGGGGGGNFDPSGSSGQGNNNSMGGGPSTMNAFNSNMVGGPSNLNTQQNRMNQMGANTLVPGNIVSQGNLGGVPMNGMGMMHGGGGANDWPQGPEFVHEVDFPALVDSGPTSYSGVGGGNGPYGNGIQQQQQQQGPEFAIQHEDFPALPGAGKPSKQHKEENNNSNNNNNNNSNNNSNNSVNNNNSKKTLGDEHIGPYGLMGLLPIISNKNQDLSLLALGSDLTTLGLNLNASHNLYETFSSPWAETPGIREPKYKLPHCYIMQKLPIKPTHLGKFHLETLFYIFYAMPKDLFQGYAAQELYEREWRYQTDTQLWFKRTRAEDIGTQPNSQTIPYMYFDRNTWERRAYPVPVTQGLKGLLSEEEVRVKFDNRNT